MHKILSWDLLQWLESLPIASHCLRKIAIFVDLIRRRSVWSLRTVLSQCRVNVSLEKLHKHMWFKYYTQRGVLEYEWREHKYTFRDSPARKSHLGVRWITSSLTERYRNDFQDARKISAAELARPRHVPGGGARAAVSCAGCLAPRGGSRGSTTTACWWRSS